MEAEHCWFSSLSLNIPLTNIERDQGSLLEAGVYNITDVCGGLSLLLFLFFCFFYLCITGNVCLEF
jgi:ABC-type uncharacterized transport system permease subunit